MHSNRSQWSQEQINFLSDVIAEAVLVKTDPLGTPDEGISGVREVESTFLVQKAFKGEFVSGKQLVVHHFEDSSEPMAISGSGDHPHEGAKYLLYLRVGLDNRFEPTSRLGDPGISARPAAAVSRA